MNFDAQLAADLIEAAATFLGVVGFGYGMLVVATEWWRQ